MASSLPEVLAEDILVRLPVESLLRFKCVCKMWHKIIKSPDFIREHCKHRNKVHKILVYDRNNPPDPITLISKDGVLENPPPDERVRGMTYVLGSVYGLFLLKKVVDGNFSLSLWNPALREVRHLPDPTFEVQPYTTNPQIPLIGKFGIGLDPITNDYKVVWFLYFSDDDNIPRIYATVYSCSRDSWRMLQLNDRYKSHICARRFRQPLGTGYLNGTYYWLVLGAWKCSIVSFDFRNEEFGEIEGPNAGRPFDHHHLVMILLDDDSIALMTNVRVCAFEYEIWVMVQPGLWNKLFALKCFTYTPSMKSWFPSTVIYVTRRSHLVSYNVRTGKSRHLGFHHPGLNNGVWNETVCSVHIYKESLVTIRRELQLN
ncbi:hypothetical protein CQW23_19680 [Capsicum baccatum]|uniref:F-box domain-containing protein n=1 Tax=Capsicum baccatum TaxID=33114 RepID=A0A2G2W6H6_CAPBA|nr:hypothetical protein CQW23_19680 [Capsicum baccatum]